MRCRMLKSVGSASGWAYNTGTEVRAGATWSKDTVPADTLAGWVLAGLAEPIPGQSETAALDHTETAAAPPARRRPRGR